MSQLSNPETWVQSWRHCGRRESTPTNHLRVPHMTTHINKCDLNTHTHNKSTDKNTAKVSKQESKASSKAVRVSMACGHKHRTYLTLGLHLVWLLSLSLQKSYFKHQKFPFTSSECLSFLPWQFSIIKKSTTQHGSLSSVTYRFLLTVSALTGWP